jgi:hypothetical protein
MDKKGISTESTEGKARQRIKQGNSKRTGLFNACIPLDQPWNTHDPPSPFLPLRKYVTECNALSKMSGRLKVESRKRVVVEGVCCRDGPQFTYSNSSQNGRLSSAGSPVVSRRNSSSSQSSRPSSTNDVGVAVGAAVTVLVTNKIFLVDAGAVGVAAEDAAATADEETRAALKGMPDAGTGGTVIFLETHKT